MLGGFLGRALAKGCAQIVDEGHRIRIDKVLRLYYNWGMRQSASFRLTPTALALLTAIAEAEGVSRTAILEITIREAAAKRRIGIASTATNQPDEPVSTSPDS